MQGATAAMVASLQKWPRNSFAKARLRRYPSKKGLLYMAAVIDSSFKTRAKSAAILAPAVLVIIFFGGKGFALMMAAAAAIGGYEWAKMVLTNDKPHPAIVPMASAVTGLGAITAAMVDNPIIPLVFLLALCFMVFAFNFSQGGPRIRLTLFGILYVGFSCAIMIWLRNGTADGLFNLLTLLFIIWASDIFAYLTGKSLGGPKLAPAISPKKTWSGFIGSSVGAGLVAAGMACPWMVAHTGVTTLGGMGSLGYFVMGFVLAMFGQAGDLFISIFKRHYGIKDTGTIIPGHGGILDRIDALLLVAILFGAMAHLLGA